MRTRRAIVGCCSFILLSTISPCEQRKPAPSQGTYTFQSNVDVVLVPVVVRDRKGAAVGDLRKEEFQVFDNNRQQVISGFMIESNAHARSARKADSTAPASAATSPRRFVVFLFDDLHMSISDFVQTREAAKRVFASLDDAEEAAVVSLSGLVNSGMNADRMALREAMMKIQPQSFFRKTETDCPNMDYYHAELIVNEHSSVALQAATEDVLNCNPSLSGRDVAARLAESLAERAFALGEHDIQVSLTSLRELVKRIAALPGLSTLVLLSPGFLTLTAQAKTEESQIIDTATLSNITINALDARGLYTTELDASDRGASSTFTTHIRSEYHRASMPLSENVMAELASGTGGTYVHNTNDLESGLRLLTSAPEYLYLLQFHPRDLKRNNSYHRLEVKVDREDLKVQTRRGYFVPKLSKKSTL